MSKGYYAIDKSGQLRHYKYVKREKINGKWRYYYEDDFSNKVDVSAAKGRGEQKTARDTAKAPTDTYKKSGNSYVDRVKDWLGYDEAARASDAADKYRNAGITRDSFDKNVVGKNHGDWIKQEYKTRHSEGAEREMNLKRQRNMKESLEKSRSTLKDLDSKMTKAGEEYMKAQAEYNKTPLAKIRNANSVVKSQIEKGKKAVQSWLEKLSASLNELKTNISKTVSAKKKSKNSQYVHAVNTTKARPYR